MLRIKEIRLLLCFGHRYRQLRGDAVIELHLNVITAERLDVGVEVDLALVDVEAVLLFDLLRNLLCGDGAEQSAALARLCGDADGRAVEVCGLENDSLGASIISEFAPPITPATATGLSLSQMASILSLRS